MINSMTGYGSATGQIQDAGYTLRIKAVNNRYFKANVKVPDLLAFLESDIEKLLRENLHRGAITYVLRLTESNEAVGVNIDQRLLRKYVEKLTQCTHQAEINCNIDLAALLLLPGILQPQVPDEQQMQETRQEILNATCQALDELKQMRATEGAALQADLEANCQAIDKNVRRISQRRHIVVKEYHEKLKQRTDELLADAKLSLDAETLAREVAIHADRCDISEEITRLDSHLDQFLQSCKVTDHPGRKLDFIAQEMLREANTIASKAADTEITQCVIDIKCRIDRLKEQVQNVE